MLSLITPNISHFQAHKTSVFTLILLHRPRYCQVSVETAFPILRLECQVFVIMLTSSSQNEMMVPTGNGRKVNMEIDTSQ